MKKQYKSPQLTVVAINVEHGYAYSSTPEPHISPNPSLTNGTGSGQFYDVRSAHSTWTASDGVAAEATTEDESFW